MSLLNNRCSFIAVFCVLLGTKSAGAQIDPGYQFLLPNSTVTFGETFKVPLLLTNVEDIMGFETSVRHDPAFLRLDDIVVAGVSMSPDAIGRGVEADGGWLGAIMDTMPPQDRTIGPGADQLIAEWTYTVVGDSGVTTLEFVDGEFGAPTVDNKVIVDGLSIGTVDGLGLIDGQVTIEAPSGNFGFDLEDRTVGLGDTFTIPITLSSTENVEFFVAVVEHDPVALHLDEVKVAGGAASADFIQIEQQTEFGSLGVVMDLFEPFDVGTLAAGERMVGELTYTVIANAPTTTALTFVDGKYGNPILSNSVGVLGGSVFAADGLHYMGGAITIVPEPTNQWFFVSCLVVAATRRRSRH